MKTLYKIPAFVASFICFKEIIDNEAELFDLIELGDREQKTREFVGVVRFITGQQENEKFIEDSASKALFEVMKLVGIKEALRRAHSVLERKGDYKSVCNIMEKGQEKELGLTGEKTVKYLVQEIKDLLKKLKI